MAANTAIEWTGATWTPIRARDLQTGRIGWFCEHASPGCQFCYAETFNLRLGNRLEFIAQNRDKVEIFLDDEMLRQPLRWKRPREIFVCSMTDLFGSFVPSTLVYPMTAIMVLCSQHTFQVLTKRPDRMAKYFLDSGLGVSVGASLMKAARGDVGQEIAVIDITHKLTVEAKPLSNIWLGTSVEDQRRADERREPMRRLAERGWLTWVSYEPALEEIDWTGWEFIKWMVIGGESGRDARLFNVEWMRSALRFCKKHGIAAFDKQLGARPLSIADRITHRGYQGEIPSGFYRYLRDAKGGDMAEWPEDLQVREYPR